MQPLLVVRHHPVELVTDHELINSEGAFNCGMSFNDPDDARSSLHAAVSSDVIVSEKMRHLQNAY